MNRNTILFTGLITAISVNVENWYWHALGGKNDVNLTQTAG